MKTTSELNFFNMGLTDQVILSYYNLLLLKNMHQNENTRKHVNISKSQNGQLKLSCESRSKNEREKEEQNIVKQTQSFHFLIPKSIGKYYDTADL